MQTTRPRGYVSRLHFLNQPNLAHSRHDRSHTPNRYDLRTRKCRLGGLRACVNCSRGRRGCQLRKDLLQPQV